MSIVAFKEAYDCEIFISEIERRLAVYKCLLTEYSDRGLKGGLLGGGVCETVVCF